MTRIPQQARRESWLEGMGRDVRDGLRRLARHPGFTLLAGGTLALGLSTSTAVFSWVEAYRLSFPGADAEHLYQVYRNTPDAPFGAVSWPDYQDMAADAAGGSGLFEVAGASPPMFGASARHETLTEVVFGQGVTGDYFRLLGIGMTAGRGLSEDDDRPGAPPAVVISHAYWMKRYGSDPAALGRTLLLNNEPYTIVGIVGPGFVGSSSGSKPEVWLPFEQYMRVYWARSQRRTDREARVVLPYVRLHAGTTAAQAQQALQALAASLDREAPLARESREFTLRPATWISPAAREAEASGNRIMVLSAAFLLLLACANVANLVLAAGARRHHEMSVRGALGASRGRLVRLLLIENLILSGFAGLLALVVAGPIADRLSSYLARPSVWGTNVAREIVVDPRVIAFALAIAVTAGVVAGLAPALRAAGRDPGALLNRQGRWASAGRGRWPAFLPGVRELLVTVQIALSVVLLFVAGLVVRTLDAARQIDPGFDTATTLASYITTSSMGVPVDERHRFYQDMIRRFSEMPWVRAATVSEYAPLSAHPEADLRIDGAADPVHVTVARVFPGYFEALGMQILSGRSLLSSDTAADAGVAIVNESLARRFQPGDDAVGRRVWLPGRNGEADRGFDVVGVVRNARITRFLDEPEPVVYFSLPQHYSAPGNALLLSVNGNPTAAVARMEQQIHAVDSRIAIVNILPYSDVVTGFLYAQRMNAEMFSVMAFIGLVLSAAGLFGVVTLAVTRRQREFGIRMAIGADTKSIAGLLLRAVSGPVVLGILIGLAGALFASRLVASLLWGVTPADPVSLAGGITVLLVCVALALVRPLVRATRVDPVGSLRAE